VSASTATLQARCALHVFPGQHNGGLCAVRGKQKEVREGLGTCIRAWALAYCLCPGLGGCGLAMSMATSCDSSCGMSRELSPLVIIGGVCDAVLTTVEIQPVLSWSFFGNLMMYGSDRQKGLVWMALLSLLCWAA
jgi:hypothetical protein